MNKALACFGALAAAMLLTGCESTINKAAERGDAARVQQLLDQGADIDKRTFAYGLTPLISAAGAGNTNVVALLLSKGANPNAPSAIGWTALMAAAWNGHAECVRMLLEHGADVTRRTVASPDQPACTALDLARKSGHAEIVQLLEAAAKNGTPTTTAAQPTMLPANNTGSEPF
jgi:uncharacterized protein